MNTNEVPQDENKNFAGEKKAIYAKDENGNYQVVRSSGWSVEEFFTSQAVEDLQLMTEQALDRVKKGQSSPLEFHMYNQRMDVVILSQVTGFFQWQIKRHFKPNIFQKLSGKKKEKYARALDLPVEELDRLPGS